MKTTYTKAYDLHRSMIFKLFGKKYIISNVIPNPGNRYTDVEFFELNCYGDTAIQVMTVSCDFQFKILTK